MTDNIVTLIHEAGERIMAARKTLAEPAREVAQLVFYVPGNPNAMMVRFNNMKIAEKAYKDLCDRRTSNAFLIVGAASTCMIPAGVTVGPIFLVDIEMNNMMLLDTQRRANAMSQLP